MSKSEPDLFPRENSFRSYTRQRRRLPTLSHMFKNIAVLLAWTAAVAQSPALKQLAYPAGTKLLIIHADDLAVAHAVDRASFAALDSGAASSASIMVPCPWLTEVAAYARQNPEADLGLHLTLTSEWKNYRWGPVARGNMPGLTGADGYLWPDTPVVVKNARPEEVANEIRAQIERALTMGIRPTHLDSHMGTLFTPAFFAEYVKAAREYGIPFFAPRVPGGIPPALASLLKDSDVLPDAVVMAPGNAKAENWREFYSAAIRGLKPGLTEMIVHLGYDDAELQAITADHPAYGSAWRQRDFNLVTSPEFRALLRDNGVKLIQWRDIKKVWKP
jgi:chitin disaccharide deacetylase